MYTEQQIFVGSFLKVEKESTQKRKQHCLGSDTTVGDLKLCQDCGSANSEFVPAGCCSQLPYSLGMGSFTVG